MKEQIVSYKTAVLAKSKGFNVLCKERWTDQYGLCGYFEEYMIGIHYDKSNVPIRDTYLEDPEITFFEKNENWYAPSQALLHKWLRGQGIGLFVKPSNKAMPWNGRYKIELLGKDRQFRYVVPVDYPTYEEALEEGLIEALKLLKSEE